jgi:hypothetical protein
MISIMLSLGDQFLDGGALLLVDVEDSTDFKQTKGQLVQGPG